MDATQRQQEIYNYLSIKKTAEVSLLCEKFFASPATIRRDLTQMELRGLLRRSRGRASILEGSGDELSLFTRQQENAAQKNRIALLASYFLKDSYSVFMDSSSTVCAAAHHLSHLRDLSVITNGVHCALALTQNATCGVYLPGGRLAARSNSVIGSDTLEDLGHFHADVALVSCSGVSVDMGATESIVEQARIKRRMLEQSSTRLLLCDSSKLGRVFLSRTAPLSLFDFFLTDCDPGKEWKEALAVASCELVYPEF